MEAKYLELNVKGIDAWVSSAQNGNCPLINLVTNKFKL